jgi:hypothetical protein
VLLFLILACGGPTKDTAADLTDQQVCQQATDEMMACSLSVDADSNVSNCVASDDSYRSCLRAALGDCNAEALCGFAALCGASPAGSAGCPDTTQCQLECSSAADPGACWCGCVGAMDPNVARYVSANDSCSSYNCYAQCEGPSANPTDCAACNASECSGVDDECQAH